MPVLDDVFALILRLDQIAPHPSLPKRLGPLLGDLRKPVPLRDPQELVALIHALWISHTDIEAEAMMAKAIAAIDQNEPQRAKQLVDSLLSRTPQWSEAFYKRAIIALMVADPSEAMGFLGQTLRLEPRHFAAVSLFGQACLNLGRSHEARAALQIALRLNPHLKGLRGAIAGLDKQLVSGDNPLNG